MPVLLIHKGAELNIVKWADKKRLSTVLEISTLTNWLRLFMKYDTKERDVLAATQPSRDSWPVVWLALHAWRAYKDRWNNSAALCCFATLAMSPWLLGLERQQKGQDFKIVAPPVTVVTQKQVFHVPRSRIAELQESNGKGQENFQRADLANLVKWCMMQTYANRCETYADGRRHVAFYHRWIVPLEVWQQVPNLSMQSTSNVQMPKAWQIKPAFPDSLRFWNLAMLPGHRKLLRVETRWSPYPHLASVEQQHCLRIIERDFLLIQATWSSVHL